MITTTQRLANKSSKRNTNDVTTLTLCPQIRPRVAAHAQPALVITRPKAKTEEERPKSVTLRGQTFRSRNTPALPADVIDHTQGPVVHPHIEDEKPPSDSTHLNNSNAGNPVGWFEPAIPATIAPIGDAQTETTVEGLKELLVTETILGFGRVITELGKTVKLSKEAIWTLTKTFQALASASTFNDLDKKPGGVYARPDAPLQPSAVQIKSENHRTSSPSQPKHRRKKTPNRARRGKPHPSYLTGESGRSRPSSSAKYNSQPDFSIQNAPLQHRQSQSPPHQKQNVPHTSNNLNAVSQQPATTSHPKSPGREPPLRTRYNDRYTLSRDSYL